MSEHEKNFMKWLCLALFIFIAVMIMYYKNRPIPAVEQPPIKTYQMEVKPIRD